VVDADIAPYIPVWDKSTRNDGTFSRTDFTFDKEKNIYTCPAGKKLTTTGHVSTDHKFRYLASIRDCKICPLKANCCPNMPQRRVADGPGPAASTCNKIRAMCGLRLLAIGAGEQAPWVSFRQLQIVSGPVDAASSRLFPTIEARVHQAPRRRGSSSPNGQRG